VKRVSVPNNGNNTSNIVNNDNSQGTMIDTQTKRESQKIEPENSLSQSSKDSIPTSKSFKRTNKHSLEITSLTPETQKPKVEEKRFYISKDSKGIDKDELVEPLLDDEKGVYWEDTDDNNETCCQKTYTKVCNSCSLL